MKKDGRMKANDIIGRGPDAPGVLTVCVLWRP